MVVDKLWNDLSVLFGATGETSSGLTGETRVSVTPEKRTPIRKRDNIHSYVYTKKGSNSQSG